MGGFSGAIGSLWVEIGARIASFEAGLATVTSKLSGLGDKVKPVGDGLQSAFDKAAKGAAGAKVPIEQVQDAFQRLGVTSSAELQKTAASMSKDFDLIRSSGQASARDIDAAWVKMETARIAAARSVGTAISTESTAALAKVKAEVEGVTKALDFSKIGSNLTSVGTTLTAGLTLPIVGLGTAAIKASGDFDTAMRLVSAKGDITGAGLEKLSRQAEELGAKTKFSSREAAEGMSEFAGAGFTVQEIYSAIPGTLSLAAAAQTSVGDAATTVKDLLGQFGLQASDTGRAVDVLAKAGNLSSGSLAQLATSLKVVGPVARSAGLDLEQTNAALLVLDKAGIRGEMAGTALRGMLASLAAPSDQARTSMDALKISITDAQGKMLPFSTIMEQAKIGLSGIKDEGEKTAHIVNLFGREGLAAATILTTQGAPALLNFQGQLKDVTGEADRTASVMNSGMGGALEKMRGSVETAAQKIGDVLAPVVIDIAGKIEDTANKVADFGRWFATLPSPIQATAIAITGFAIAIGPVLLLLGQLSQSIVALNALLPIMGKAVATVTGFLGVGLGTLTAYTAGIVAAVAAIGVITVKYGQMKDAQADAAKAGDQFAVAQLRLENHLKSQGAAVDALKSQYVRGQITQTEYMQGLQKMAIAIGNTKKQTTEQNKELTEAGKLQKQLEDALRRGAKATEEATKTTKEAVTHVKSFKDSQTLLAETIKQTTAAREKELQSIVKWKLAHQDAASVTPKFTQVTDELSESIRKMVAEAKHIPPVFIDAGKQGAAPIRELQEAFKTLGITSSESLEEQADKAQKAYERIRDAGINSAADVAAALEKAEAKRQEVVDNSTKKAVDAYKKLGITSSESLKRQAEEARKAFEQINSDTNSSLGDRNRAWAEFESKRIEAAKAAGEIIPDEQEKALARMEDQLGQSHGKQKDQWGDFSKQVSTIITDAGKNIIGRFTELGDFNEKLDEQASALRESLAEREENYNEFAANIEESLADAHAGYAETLAKEEASLRDSLEERRADYEEFSADVLDKIGELREKHEKAAEKERKSILDGLDDRTQDYGDYKEDIEDKILDIRRSHDESAKKEKADLAKSLKERTIDYNRYVEDVQTKLLRIREKNKGQFSEEEADLLKSLQRRTEDFQAYQQENAAKLNEVTTKHQEESARQEQDQRDSLARKLRDFEEYQADVAAKLGEVAIKHKQEQEKEESDLQKSLDRKRDDLAKYETDAVAKFEAIREGAKEKLDKQEADLREKLANQTAEWTKYKDSVAKELQGIEDQHLGIFGKIAEVGKGIFTDLGLAIGRFVSEYLVGKLFKSLGELVTDILPGVGKALSDVFGKGAGAASTAANAAQQAAGAGADAGAGAANTAGSIGSAVAGSGVTAIVGAIGSVGSMVSGIISNFQNAKQETTLNAIEESTRYTKIWTGEGSYSILQNTGKTRELLGYLNTTADAIGRKMDDWLSPLTGQLQEIESKAGWSLAKLDEISNNSYWGSAAEKDNTSLLTQMLTELRTMAAKSPVINVYVNGALAPASSSSSTLKMQGVLGI